MAKNKKKYQCSECSHVQTTWSGQCDSCQEYGSLEETSPNSGIGETEEIVQVIKRYAPKTAPMKFSETKDHPETRYITDIRELDKVLGGGLCATGVYILSGAPGSGKSTLALDIAGKLSQDVPVLVASAEESAQQITSRARRLDLLSSEVNLLIENDIDEVITIAEKLKAKLLVIDSIQTMYTTTSKSSIGSVTQVKECAQRLTRFAKTSPSAPAVLIIGQIIKNGDAAGPNAVLHLADSTLTLDIASNNQQLRTLSATKNRFGSTDEIALFNMQADGLREVTNASRLFLSSLIQDTHGSVINVSQETLRPLLTPIQALTDETANNNPARHVVGLSRPRLLMILAIINQHTELKTSNKDVFVSNVGGISLSEPATDLAVLVAVISSLTKKVIPSSMCFMGEISLVGEIKQIPNCAARIKEADSLGMQRIIIPRANKHSANTAQEKLVYVNTVQDVLAKIMAEKW